MPRKTKSVAVRLTENDLKAVHELKDLVRETYVAAGVQPPDTITNAWAIRASIGLHRRCLDGSYFCLPMDKFRERNAKAMMEFALLVAQALGADLEGIEYSEDFEAGVVTFRRDDEELVTVSTKGMDRPDIPAPLAAH